MSIQRLVLSLATWLVVTGASHAQDWPQFLGPTRNGVYAGTNLAASWPKEGPPIAWQKKVGAGFSGPIVAAGKLIVFHRLGDQETVECLNAETGTPLWKFEYPTAYRDDFGFDEGPRATSAIADGKVYTFGAEGALHCLDLATGKKVWSIKAGEQFTTQKGFFGMACSPLLEGNNLLLNIGGTGGAGLVAFDRNTGTLAWKATDDEASYSSPVAATFPGGRRALFFTRSGLVVVEPQKGRVLAQFPWRARTHASVNAATPLVAGDLIFLSASYETGGALVEVDAALRPKIRWQAPKFGTHFSTAIAHEGHIYGLDESILACLDAN